MNEIRIISTTDLEFAIKNSELTINVYESTKRANCSVKFVTKIFKFFPTRVQTIQIFIIHPIGKNVQLIIVIFK